MFGIYYRTGNLTADIENDGNKKMEIEVKCTCEGCNKEIGQEQRVFCGECVDRFLAMGDAGKVKSLLDDQVKANEIAERNRNFWKTECDRHANKVEELEHERNKIDNILEQKEMALHQTTKQLNECEERLAEQTEKVIKLTEKLEEMLREK